MLTPLFAHQGNLYKILRQIPFHSFEDGGMDKVKTWRDYLGADHVLKSKTHFMFCETIQEAQIIS